MPEISTDDVVQRAKAALESVTAGPWTWTHGMDSRSLVLGPDDLKVRLEGYADAEFIAAARSLVPELVAEVERLRGLNAALLVGQSNLQVLLSDAHAAVEPADPHAGELWANELERRTRQVAPGEWS